VCGGGAISLRDVCIKDERQHSSVQRLLVGCNYDTHCCLVSCFCCVPSASCGRRGYCSRTLNTWKHIHLPENIIEGLFGSFSWSDARFWGRDVYVYRLGYRNKLN